MSYSKSLKYKFRFLYIRIIAPAIIRCIFFFFPRKEKTLLLIKTDGIGDYVLFRNYLAFLRSSTKYKDHSIYLLTNVTNSELALPLDSQFVDGFFWYADSYFMKWKVVNLLFRLQQLRPSTIFFANYSRTFTIDWLVNNIKANDKIGINGDTVNQSSQLKEKTDKYYSELITVGKKNLHEFEQNRQIFEAFTDEVCSLTKPFIEKDRLHIIPNKSVVIFPGGSEKAKRWSPENFNALCKLIIDKLDTNIILTGGQKELFIGKEIAKGIEADKISDQIGKATLVQLCEIIGGAKLLISNDSVAVHIAVALDIPVICISKGDLYGRFVPYPATISANLKNISPKSFSGSPEAYSQWSSSNINEVTVSAVFDAVQQFLINSHNTVEFT